MKETIFTSIRRRVSQTIQPAKFSDGQNLFSVTILISSTVTLGILAKLTLFPASCVIIRNLRKIRRLLLLRLRTECAASFRTPYEAFL
ncbi:unnamed protein product [Dibothriocephalus latus]|uniref:Uncharacterized protein n=1 Tax=Dibothriocephalus latus TaxID=60516 RepID=A0A3P7P7N1_DIBLA|nr:unnamed protein product [Dibothriocephalus latus]